MLEAEFQEVIHAVNLFHKKVGILFGSSTIPAWLLFIFLTNSKSSASVKSRSTLTCLHLPSSTMIEADNVHHTPDTEPTLPYPVVGKLASNPKLVNVRLSNGYPMSP